MDENKFSDHNSKNIIFSLFAETTFFNKKIILKRIFKSRPCLAALFRSMRLKYTQLGQKSCLEISTAIYLGPKR